MEQEKIRVLGSVKNSIIATELVEERRKCDFDQNEIKSLLVDPEAKKIMDKTKYDLENDPKLKFTHKYYEWTPQEIQQMWMQKLNYLWFHKDRKFYFKDGHQINFSW